MKRLKTLAFAAMAACGLTVAANAQFQSEALVEALLQKGVLTTQEAEDIKADLAKEYKSTPGGKLDINKSVKKLKLYGDFRGRYELRQNEAGYSATPPNPATTALGNIQSNNNKQAGVQDQWRARIRLRVGAEYQFSEGFLAGFELGTASQNAAGIFSDQRSNNADLQDAFAFNAIAVTKAFAQVDLVKYINQNVYLDTATFGFGKFKNPLKSSNMMWDGDITPGGAWQTFTKKFDADGTELTPFITTGQFVVNDNIANPTVVNNASGNRTRENQWLIPVQGGVDIKFQNKNKMSFAATYYYWMAGLGNGGVAGGSGVSGLNTTSRGNQLNGRWGGAGQVSQNNATGNIRPVTLYGDYTFAKTWSDSVPLKLWTELLYNPSMANANTGIQAGIELGQLKSKGNWQVGGYFNYIEQNAWYDGFTDSDFSDGSVNRFGGVWYTGYALTDFASINARYFLVSDIRENPRQYGATFAQPATEVGRLQLDIIVKF